MLRSTVTLYEYPDKYSDNVYQCDTSACPFSVYLDAAENGTVIKFKKISKDDNRITLWGVFQNDADYAVIGFDHSEVVLICNDGKWTFC